MKYCQKHYQKLHETRWTSVHECLDSIIRLKRCLEEIHDEHSSSISNNSVISILRSRAFFKDVGYLANTLLPIKLAILEVEGRGTGIKYGQFYNIVGHAGSIWKSLGKKL
ncbi:2720_t:CDS:2 [Entrophospora sp. SA101]|nr:2720_t:CDS:2 [Entrophospora sp. SA101]